MYELKNLTKKYQQTTVLENVDFEFPEKGLVVIMGESGTGKSTLLNMLSGLDADYEGVVSVGGQNLKELTTQERMNYRKDYVGVIFQDYQLLEGYTALENVVLSSFVHQNRGPKSRERKALQQLEKMGLADKSHQKIETLSGGQKQRVAIARALLNDPKIILADEPTGALDRQTATEIMAVIQEIAQEKLVVLITHDPYICEFADEVLTIGSQQIMVQRPLEKMPISHQESLALEKYPRIPTAKLALKNVKVNLGHYLLISLIFAIGAICTLVSLSSNNMIEQSISDFQNKNSALSNGYIKDEDGNSKAAFERLQKDQRVTDVYKQYILKDLTLKYQQNEVLLAEKYPMPKGKEVFSYGGMPRKNKKEVAISGTLAKKFKPNINELIGDNLTVMINNQSQTLTISGICNAGYDDIFLSSDIEQSYYQNVSTEKWYSVSFDVKSFNEVLPVYQTLTKAKITVEMATREVAAMMKSFAKIKQLFMIVTSLIALVCLFIVIIMLSKLQKTRQKMIGLLGAIGFKSSHIRGMIAWENRLLALLATSITGVLVGVCFSIAKVVNFPIILSLKQVSVTMGMTFIIVLGIGFILKQLSMKQSIMDSLKS